MFQLQPQSEGEIPHLPLSPGEEVKAPRCQTEWSRPEGSREMSRKGGTVGPQSVTSENLPAAALHTGTGQTVGIQIW